MKRIITGIDAYNKMLTTPLPTKTKTYTPVSHMAILNLVRKELGFRGYKLLNEFYSSNQNGTVVTVACIFEFIDHPELSMSAVFVNSYDKTTKFQFKLGGVSKIHGTFIINDDFSGSLIKRKHTGSAVDIINQHITESLNGISMTWEVIKNYADNLKDCVINVKGDSSARIIGHLTLNDTLDSTQLNNVRERLKAVSSGVMTMWEYYHIAAAAMSSTHPKLWNRSYSLLAAIVDAEANEYQFNLKTKLKHSEESYEHEEEIAIREAEFAIEEKEMTIREPEEDSVDYVSCPF